MNDYILAHIPRILITNGRIVSSSNNNHICIKPKENIQEKDFLIELENQENLNQKQEMLVKNSANLMDFEIAISDKVSFKF